MYIYQTKHIKLCLGYNHMLILKSFVDFLSFDFNRAKICYHNSLKTSPSWLYFLKPTFTSGIMIQPSCSTDVGRSWDPYRQALATNGFHFCPCSRIRVNRRERLTSIHLQTFQVLILIHEISMLGNFRKLHVVNKFLNLPKAWWDISRRFLKNFKLKEMIIKIKFR